MTEEPRILPCPFCGRKTTVYRTRFGWETIECRQCDVKMGATEHDHIDGVIQKRWNTRSPAIAEPCLSCHEHKWGLCATCGAVQVDRPKNAMASGMEWPPEPVVNPSASWCDRYAEWFALYRQAVIRTPAIADGVGVEEHAAMCRAVLALGNACSHVNWPWVQETATKYLREIQQAEAFITPPQAATDEG